MKENQRKCFKCGRSPSANPYLKLYRFPRPGVRNTVRCESWASYCFPEGYSANIPEKLYSEHKMLCNQHFRPESFLDFSRKILHRWAVPAEVQKIIVYPSAPLESVKPSEPLLLDISNVSNEMEPQRDPPNICVTSKRGIESPQPDPLPVATDVKKITVYPSEAVETVKTSQPLLLDISNVSNEMELQGDPSNIFDTSNEETIESPKPDPLASPTDVKRIILYPSDIKKERKIHSFTSASSETLKPLQSLLIDSSNVSNETELQPDPSHICVTSNEEKIENPQPSSSNVHVRSLKVVSKAKSKVPQHGPSNTHEDNTKYRQLYTKYRRAIQKVCQLKNRIKKMKNRLFRTP